MTKRKYIVAGYAVDSKLPDITKEDLLKLTHLNVAFGHSLRFYCPSAAGALAGSLKRLLPKREDILWRLRRSAY